jgi:hypothetical protein
MHFSMSGFWNAIHLPILFSVTSQRSTWWAKSESQRCTYFCPESTIPKQASCKSCGATSTVLSSMTGTRKLSSFLSVVTVLSFFLVVSEGWSEAHHRRRILGRRSYKSKGEKSNGHKTHPKLNDENYQYVGADGEPDEGYSQEDDDTLYSDDMSMPAEPSSSDYDSADDDMTAPPSSYDELEDEEDCIDLFSGPVPKGNHTMKAPPKGKKHDLKGKKSESKSKEKSDVSESKGKGKSKSKKIKKCKKKSAKSTKSAKSAKSTKSIKSEKSDKSDKSDKKVKSKTSSKKGEKSKKKSKNNPTASPSPRTYECPTRLRTLQSVKF